MARNRRIVDRVLPREVGGFPVNYGFVPQTISYARRNHLRQSRTSALVPDNGWRLTMPCPARCVDRSGHC